MFLSLKDLVNKISGLHPLDHSLQLKTDIGNLNYVKLNFVKNIFELTGCLSNSIDGISDVIPGEYEGGFKVWESTTDLVNLIAAMGDDVKNKRVLDVSNNIPLVNSNSIKIRSR